MNEMAPQTVYLPRAYYTTLVPQDLLHLVCGSFKRSCSISKHVLSSLRVVVVKFCFVLTHAIDKSPNLDLFPILVCAVLIKVFCLTL